MTLIREIKEETGVEINEKDIKLFKIVENFFGYSDNNFHELLFVYKIHNKILNKMDNFRTIDKEYCYNKWFLKSEIENIEVRPSEYQKWIFDKNAREHIIIDEL